MRLFFYYASHSFKNQIRKLFKSSFLIFFVVCALIGGLIGFGASALSDIAEQRSENAETVQEALPEEDPEEVPEDMPDEEEEPDVIEINGERLSLRELVSGKLELIVHVLLLLIFLFEISRADRSGSSIFLPADVNLLFPSPMKPQSVLLFRLMCQIGAAIAASIYLVFQLPNLTMLLGFSSYAAIAVIAVYVLLIITGRILQVLIYTIASTYPATKPYFRRIPYAIAGLLLLVLAIYKFATGAGILDAAVALYGGPATRLVPLIGWLRGIFMCAVEGKYLYSLLYAAATAAGVAVLAVLVWRIRADFYEEAMARSEEMAALLAQVQEEGGLAKRKKDRSDRIRRNTFERGNGASVYLYKALYNRFRFGHLRYFTKTAETYLVVAILGSLFTRFVLDINGFLAVMLVLGVLVFYRALGSPLEEDAATPYFVLIPESMAAKVFYSLLGGTANCLLDLLPAVLIACVLGGENPLRAAAFLLFLLTVDYYATAAGTFVTAASPKNTEKTFRQIILVFFLYFGLLPDVAIIAAGAAFGKLAIGLTAAAVFNVLLGSLFLPLAAITIDPPGGIRYRKKRKR